MTHFLYHEITFLGRGGGLKESCQAIPDLFSIYDYMPLFPERIHFILEKQNYFGFLTICLSLLIENMITMTNQ